MSSGSSFGGIDAVLARIWIAPDGHPTKPEFVDGIAYPRDPQVVQSVLRAFANELTIFELTRLNYVAGAVCAQAARALLDKTGIAPEEVDVIGVDGQTIYAACKSANRH